MQPKYPLPPTEHVPSPRNLQRVRTLLARWLILGSLPTSLCVSLMLGQVSINLTDVARHGVAFFFEANSLTSAQAFESSVFWHIRLPRTIAGLMVGWALGCAGVLTQGVFRNPLAAPSMLGVTSGASFAVVLGMYWNLTGSGALSQPVLAVIGACSVTVLVLLLGRFAQGHPAGILLIGLSLNAMLAAAITVTLSLSLQQFERLAASLRWLMGSLSGIDATYVMLFAPLLAFGLWLGHSRCRLLDLLAQGDDLATSQGVHTQRLRLLSVIAIALLVGGSVALAGAVGFIGLMVPHITRSLIGPMHQALFWHAGALGGSLLLTADVVARTAFAPIELEVGAVTSMLGAPFLLALILRGSMSTEAAS